MSNTNKRNILLIAAAFLLCGLLRVLLYDIDEFTDFSRLFSGAVAVCWGASAFKRVTDKRLRNMLLAIVFCFLMLLLFQSVNYQYAQENPIVRRYAWYGYYPCMMAFAVLLYELSLAVSFDTENLKGKAVWIPLGAGVILSLGVLTNDLHSLAFRFQGEMRLPGSPKSYEPLFFLFFAVFALLMLTAFLNIRRKHRQIIKNSSFLTLLPIVVLGVYLVLNMFDLTPRIREVKLWQIGETFTFCMLAFLEICIATYLIPANTNYEKFFLLSGLPAVILNEKGTVQYSSFAEEYPFPKNENTMVMQHPITGGSIEWIVDISDLNALNRELMETTQQIDARNAYLSEEARIKREKAETEERNRIYDEIIRIIRPQLDQITDLLKDPEKSFEEQLPAISVRCAFIKRRSNMELVGEKGMLPFNELALAVRESLSYVRLLGIHAAVSTYGEAVYPSDMVIAAYERVESVLEDCLEQTDDLMVSAKADTGMITVRMMLKGGTMSLPEIKPGPQTGSYSESVSVTKDGQDLILAFVFREGGKEK